MDTFFFKVSYRSDFIVTSAVVKQFVEPLCDLSAPNYLEEPFKSIPWHHLWL